MSRRGEAVRAQRHANPIVAYGGTSRAIHDVGGTASPSVRPAAPWGTEGDAFLTTRFGGQAVVSFGSMAAKRGSPGNASPLPRGPGRAGSTNAGRADRAAPRRAHSHWVGAMQPQPPGSVGVECSRLDRSRPRRIRRGLHRPYNGSPRRVAVSPRLQCTGPPARLARLEWLAWLAQAACRKSLPGSPCVPGPIDV